MESGLTTFQGKVSKDSNCTIPIVGIEAVWGTGHSTKR